MGFVMGESSSKNVHHLVCCFHQLPERLVDAAHDKRFVQVAVVAFVVDSDVYIHNVAVLQRPLVRDAMAYHLARSMI